MNILDVDHLNKESVAQGGQSCDIVTGWHGYGLTWLTNDTSAT